jgi:hypothetical protein
MSRSKNAWLKGPEPATIRRMQEVELGLIVASILGLVVLWVLRSRAHLSDRPLAIGAVIGIVPGILGAVVVLVPRTDLIPDSAEPFLWILIGLIASGIALFALTVGFARR